MVHCGASSLFAFLRVGGLPVLVFEVSGLDWFRAGTAKLVAGPALARRHIGKMYPSTVALTNACASLFGCLHHSLLLECYIVDGPDESLLGTAESRKWVNGQHLREPFSPLAAHAPVELWKWGGGDAPFGKPVPLSLLRPWLPAPLSAAQAGEELERRLAAGEHEGSSRQRARVKPEQRRKSEHRHKRARPDHEAAGGGGEGGGADEGGGAAVAGCSSASSPTRPPWHTWAAAGFRLLEGGGALDRGGAPVPEPLLATLAGEAGLPWPVDRPSRAELDDLLSNQAPHRPAAQGPSGSGSAAPRERKRRRVDFAYGRVFWLKEPPTVGPPRPMYIEDKEDLVLLLRTAGPPRSGESQAPVRIERDAVTEFATGLADMWRQHRADPQFRGDVEAAVHRVTTAGTGPYRTPEMMWAKFGPAEEPYPFGAP